MEGLQKKIVIWSAAFFSAAGFFMIAPSAAHAATLYFSPSSGKVNVGSNITVSIYVSSEDQAVNAASGKISFPADKLSVVSLSKSGSVFSLWVQEPSFSNSAGTINFEGVVLNPGFTGSGGKILGVTFKAKEAGSAKLALSDGAALANDGEGTNVLKGLGGATLTINTPPPAEPNVKPTTPAEPTPPPAVPPPAAPAVSSASHSDQNIWYDSQQLEFSLEIPKGVTGMRTLFDQNSGSVPSGEAKTPISKIVETASADGVWYLHVQFSNSAGWGPVATFQAKVDALAPERLNLALLENDAQNKRLSRFQVDAYDAGSGIDRYEISVDGGDVFSWKDSGSRVLSLPRLADGGHAINIKAIDGLGHSLSTSYQFAVKAEPLPESLRSNDVSLGVMITVSALSALVSFSIGSLLMRRKRGLKKWLYRWK